MEQYAKKYAKSHETPMIRHNFTAYDMGLHASGHFGKDEVTSSNLVSSSKEKFLISDGFLEIRNFLLLKVMIQRTAFKAV